MSIELDLDFDKLYDILENGTREELDEFCNKNNLSVEDGKVVYNGDAKEKAKFWDKYQSIRKVLLNATFGSLSNPHCRFFDKRIGQSITLSGRSVVKHMISEVNNVFTGEYTHNGATYKYSDTDSIIGSSIIPTSNGNMSIEDLYNQCKSFETDTNNDKHYGYDDDILVLSYDPEKKESYYGNINYIYKHQVLKNMYEIEDEFGNCVTVTEDHSIMVERQGELISVKPIDILDDDILISVTNPEYVHSTTASEIKRVSLLEDKKETNVFDIGMANEKTPYFFANNILVHNSVYFSAYDILKEEIDQGRIEWNKESVTSLYDNVCDQVNASFTPFMKRAFHCPPEFAKPIAAAREIIGTVGLFITKKRYAIMVYDNEGTREDVNGSPGKIKAMGLDLRRSDTPKYIQEFLTEILKLVLTKKQESAILDRIIEYRKEFRELPAWRKGTPKSVNKLTWYKEQLQRGKKVSVPGHVRASLNWNTLRSANSDNTSLEIVDGMKIVVCKLKNNPIGYTSVAFPTDETRLPEWFKELPFDEPHMEETVLDNKIDNLIGKLGYDLDSTREINCFNSLFEF